MSNVTDVYDAILTELAVLFPLKTKVFNPYAIDDNPEFVLRDGYGMAVGASTAPQNEFKSVWQERDFLITLTQQVVKSEEDSEKTDDSVKLLLEDLKTLQNEFCKSDQIGIESDIENIVIGTCSGVQFIFGNEETGDLREDFIFITQTFQMTWSELIA